MVDRRCDLSDDPVYGPWHGRSDRLRDGSPDEDWSDLALLLRSDWLDEGWFDEPHGLSVASFRPCAPLPGPGCDGPESTRFVVTVLVLVMRAIAA